LRDEGTTCGPRRQLEQLIDALIAHRTLQRQDSLRGKCARIKTGPLVRGSSSALQQRIEALAGRIRGPCGPRPFALLLGLSVLVLCHDRTPLAPHSGACTQHNMVIPPWIALRRSLPGT
jgi:hypothetical protein